MNILITGHCSTPFIVPWVRALQEKTTAHSFSVYGLVSPFGYFEKSTYELFKEIYSKEQISLNKRMVSRQIIIETIVQLNLSYVLKNLFRFKKIKEKVKETINESIVDDFERSMLEKADVVIIHYLSPSSLSILKNVKGEKVVLCFWGSDLMQASSSVEWNTLEKALKRADVVTVQNYGMKFLACTKYGWDIESKIHIAPFVLEQSILSEIRHLSKVKAKSNLSEILKIEEGKLLLCCGYRPIPMVQQLEIITELNKLPVEFKKKLQIVLVMNYSLNDLSYKDAIIEAASNSGISFEILKKHMSAKEVASLRRAIDIFIHFPQTDAMSATLMEHMLAENYIITNRNLPYGIFRKYNILFDEADTVCDIRELLESKLINFQVGTKNRSRVDTMIEREFTIDNWTNILALLSN